VYRLLKEKINGHSQHFYCCETFACSGNIL